MGKSNKKSGCPFELLLFLLVPVLIAGGIGDEWRIQGTYRRAARHLEPEVW